MPTQRLLLVAFVLISLFTMTLAAQTEAPPVPSGSFPRVGNIFGGEYLYTTNPNWAYQTQLFLGGGLTNSAAQDIRAHSPNTVLLWKVNAIETILGEPVVPDESYYLKDTNGNKIASWPGNPPDYLLNLTLPKVQQFLAQYAFQQLNQNGFVYDGIFFDNLTTTISQVTEDIYGNPVQISSQNNGIADAPGPLDAAWGAGVFAMIADLKQIIGNSYVVGHISQAPTDPRALSVFNGDSFVFKAVYVREGTLAFGTLWDAYQNWFVQGQQPSLVSMQSSPPSQIAYGYGFSPEVNALPSVINWGESFYPNMRFGLSLALMNNGFSIYNLGDVNGDVALWFDEYNFNLGNPVTPATLLGTPGGNNKLVNSGFDGALAPWTLAVAHDGVAAATAALDITTFEDGLSSAHVDVTSAGTENYHVTLQQGGISVQAGQEYTVQFWGQADSPLTFQINMQGVSTPIQNYGLTGWITLGQAWHQYSISFVSTVTATDGQLQFLLGSSAGNYWFDEVQLIPAPTRIYRRDFSNGVVLLNGTNSTQTIPLEAGLQHFTGTQAPKYQYVVDDSDPGFSATGSWIVDTFNTGFRTASPPYYNAWKYTCHELDAATGMAQWNLGIPADGQYTIQVWLPAAPAAGTWTKNATYQLIAAGQVVGSVNLDQSQASGGDQWYTLFTNQNLTAASNPVLQVTNGGTGPLIADAVFLASASLYNDGTPVSQVTLQPMDGVLLQRLAPTQTISFSALPNVTLSTAPILISATASSNLPVNFTSTTPLVCTVSGNSILLVNVGTCSISASQPGNSSFTAGIPVTQTFTVAATTQAAQTITFPAISAETLNGTVTFGATASSALTVVYASLTPSTCSVSGGNTALLIGAGTCTIGALQPGNAYFTPAPEVTQSFQVVAGPPSLISLTPVLGSTPSETYTAQVSDPNQASDLSSIFMLVNTTLSGTSACYVEYYPITNLLYLKNDANTAFAGSLTPGSATQISNSQCTLSGIGSSYSTAGTLATLNLALTFNGTSYRNTYLDATEKNGASTGWVQEGIWGIPVLPSLVSIAPSSGSGASQTFSATVSDTGGGSNINSVFMLFNKTLSGSNGCYLEYFPSTNLIGLKNDANTAFVGSITPGMSAQLSNSSCTVSGTGSSYTVSGNLATLDLALTFTATTQVSSYLYASDRTGATTGWVQEGTWGIPTPPTVPSIVSITPASGSGATQTFVATVSDTGGGSNINSVFMLFNATLSGTNGCYLEYYAATNLIELKNDANTAFVGSITPGTNAQLSNSSCTVSGAGSSYTVSGSNAELSLALTFAGTTPVSSFLSASDKGGATTGWVQEGMWGTPAAPGVPSLVSLTPNSGSGASQLFVATVSDTAGGASISSVFLLFNSTLSGTNACYVEYFPSSNTINLKNDASTGFVGNITPGANSQLSNSSCTVSGVGSSYAISGNTATLSLAVTFAGTNSILSFLDASDKSGASTGWGSEGTWTP